MEVKDLLHLEELDKVIDIDTYIETEDKAKDTIEKYVITDDLKVHIQRIAEDLKKPKHNSYQIIGNYGSGKSHFLAILAAIIDNPKLADSLQDEETKKTFKKNLDRDFAVVHFELQPSQHTLSEFFYDRLTVKLKQNYDIEIPEIDAGDIYDHKEKVREILEIIKSKNPKMGLVVIIDEISDFLKSKPSKEMKFADTQFMRVLAQASNQMDFMFLGSMQENVFESDEFIEEAESIGRTIQRYEIITISKDDIKKVLSQRALKKDIGQRDQLKELLDDYGQQIPQVQNNLNEFVELYPVHPYIIEVFNYLPYFENRGILDFTVKEVKNILDEEFPEFVTFDKIYDKMAKDHNIRQLDEIAPVVNAVETLNSKVDLLRTNHQEDAKKIIDALAVLKIYGKTTNNGATPAELANDLMIISDNITNIDRIRMILKNLREVTDGQFINKTKNDYYYLDLDHDIDYDVVIQRKAENLYDGAEDGVLLNIIKDNFYLDSDSNHDRIFDDASYWKEKKSFRKGSFIYDDNSVVLNKGDGDFNFVIVSPYQKSANIKSDSDTAILNLEYNEKLDDLLSKIAAVNSLKTGSNYPKSIMDKKKRNFLDEAKEKLLKLLLLTNVKNGGDYDSTKKLLAQEPDNLSAYYEAVKTAVFGHVFNDKYPEYPDLINRLSPENIQGEVERTIDSILTGSEKISVSNSQNLLSSLDLLDDNNRLDTTNSKYANIILDKLKNNKGKNISVNELIEMSTEPPFGLQKELVYLILLVITYNGQANLKHNNRGSVRNLTASDLKQFFSSGLNKFEEISYVSLETDFPVDAIIELFKVLDINSGLVRHEKKRTDALREFKEKIIEIEDKIEEVDNQLNNLKRKPNDFFDINKLIKKREGLKNIPIELFSKVNTITDFKKISLDKEELKELEQGLKLLDHLLGYLNDFEKFIYEEYLYMEKALKLIKENKKFFENESVDKLKDIAANCEKLLGTNEDDLMLLLEYEQRRLLKGKLNQFKEKYQAIYYRQHRDKVGENIEWSKLEEIKNKKELERLEKLKNITGINTRKYNHLRVRLNKLENIRCTKLKEEYLEESIQCPHCNFPENIDSDFNDLNDTLDDLFNQVIEIEEEWEGQIISEIRNYEDNISKLTSSEQNIVDEILEKNKLPQTITNEVITVLNTLFSELKEVEVTPNKLMEIIFKDQGVLDYEMFNKKLSEIKAWILEHGDRDNIRIKFKEIDEEE